MRALYLTEKINSHRGQPWAEFVVPADILIY